jgi:hypothetical protein
MGRIQGGLAALALLGAWALPVAAVEVQSVRLAERVRFAENGSELIINGMGVRKRVFVSVYVGALYLPRKTPSAEAILAADTSSRRLAIHILRDEITAEQLLGSFREGLEANNSPADLAAVSAGVRQLDAIFNAARVVKRGDLILFDYFPESGTKVTIGNEVKGTIPGAEFNRALMKIWLGPKPVDPELKKALLGGAS